MGPHPFQKGGAVENCHEIASFVRTSNWRPVELMVDESVRRFETSCSQGVSGLAINDAVG